jgi:uncharacterized protein (UPF0332 family)
VSAAGQLDRSRRELAAARHLVAGAFPGEAVSRAYFAAFHAAEAALLALGETRSKHAGVIAAFTQRLVVTEDIDREVGRILRSLFERRNQADYAGPEVPASEGEAAIADAEKVILAVEAWLDKRVLNGTSGR